MKVVVIGGTGLIGSQLVTKLTEAGHEALAASPRRGVNTLTGEGLDAALAGAQVVVDVSNSPSFEPQAVREFFTTSTQNLIAAARGAGVERLVVLSIVGTDRLPDNGYFQAKVAQERLVRESGLDYTIVHATQFFEFVPGIADASTVGDEVRVPQASIQPIASADVAVALAKAVLEPAVGDVEIGGPERFGFADFVREGLARRDDPREVVADQQARYFGSLLDDDSLLPGPSATLYPTRFANWSEA